MSVPYIYGGNRIIYVPLYSNLGRIKEAVAAGMGIGSITQRPNLSYKLPKSKVKDAPITLMTEDDVSALRTTINRIRRANRDAEERVTIIIGKTVCARSISQ